MNDNLNENIVDEKTNNNVNNNQNNKKSSTTILIILSIVILALIAFCVYIMYDRKNTSSNNQNNIVDDNNQKENKQDENSEEELSEDVYIEVETNMEFANRIKYFDDNEEVETEDNNSTCKFIYNKLIERSNDDEEEEEEEKGTFTPDSSVDKLIFSQDGYDVYEVNSCEYHGIVVIKDGRAATSLIVGDALDNFYIDGLYSTIVDGTGNILIDTINKEIYDEEYEYTCHFESDYRRRICDYTSVMIVQNKNEKYGLISLVDKEKILNTEYDEINEVRKGVFIVNKKGKKGIYTISKKFVLEPEHDLVLFNDKLGYIIVDGNDYKILDNNYKELNIDENTLINFYNENLEEDDEGVTLFSDKNMNNGYIMLYTDIKDIYNGEIEYKGSSYKGKQLIIINICNNDGMYVIEGKKINKISSAEIKINSDYCY